MLRLQILALVGLLLYSCTAERPAPREPFPEPAGRVWTNELGMAFVHIPAGKFMRGSPSEEDGRGMDEDLRQVTIPGDFFMQTTEVTQGQWQAVMEYNPSYFNACGPDCPVEYVSWEDVQAFITRLNQKAGYERYRLPTEAEWEYVCRAGSSQRFCFGGNDGQLGDYAWFNKNSGGKTHPVATKKPNPWGVYDMHGNVFEWCRDWYDGTPPPIFSGQLRREAPKGPFRSLRGGSWDDKAVDCRSASRSYCEPGFGNFYIGFRLVMMPESSPPQTWIEPLTGMEFVWVPSGSFFMGQNELEQKELVEALGEARYRQWYGCELPRHEVYIDGFWIGRYEVTLGEFRQFLKASAHQPTALKRGWSWSMTHQFERKDGANCETPGFHQGDRHPVVHVSWLDAVAMAEWLSQAGSGEYLLPTEAEWEFAARGGVKAARFWGDASADACEFANGHDLSSAGRRGFPWPHHGCRDGFVETAPVGSFRPNGHGLYDMLGNVSEWCLDGFEEEAYRNHALKNPAERQEGGTRVVRGGGWYSAPADMRLSVRRGACPANTDDALGFRLVRIK